jgi:hypothetical protein
LWKDSFSFRENLSQDAENQQHWQWHYRRKGRTVHDGKLGKPLWNKKQRITTNNGWYKRVSLTNIAREMNNGDDKTL